MIKEEEDDFSMKSSSRQKLASLRLNCKIRDQMKTKNFYILIIVLGATTLSLWLLSNPSPNLHTIVTQTHIQINNIKNIPQNIRTSNTEEFKVDPELLEDLGFHETHSISYKDPLKGLHDLMVGTAIKPGRYDDSMSLIKSCQTHLPSVMVLVYDLGIDYHQHHLVRILFRSHGPYCLWSPLCVRAVSKLFRIQYSSLKITWTIRTKRGINHGVI